MSGPLEPLRPLPGGLPPVPALERAPRDRPRERREDEPRRDERRDGEPGEQHGPDADGHIDLRA